MPIEGVSNEVDSFRNHVKNQCPDTSIVDSKRYDLDTFTLCEMKGYILITEPVYEDIHSNLITIPLETNDTLPYGLMYGKNPTAATKKFIDTVKQLKTN